MQPLPAPLSPDSTKPLLPALTVGLTLDTLEACAVHLSLVPDGSGVGSRFTAALRSTEPGPCGAGLGQAVLSGAVPTPGLSIPICKVGALQGPNLGGPRNASPRARTSPKPKPLNCPLEQRALSDGGHSGRRQGLEMGGAFPRPPAGSHASPVTRDLGSIKEA